MDRLGIPYVKKSTHNLQVGENERGAWGGYGLGGVDLLAKTGGHIYGGENSAGGPTNLLSQGEKDSGVSNILYIYIDLYNGLNHTISI